MDKEKSMKVKIMKKNKRPETEKKIIDLLW